MPERKSMKELLFLHPNLKINTITKSKSDKWEIVAFSVDVNDHKVVQKIGLELKTGGKAFIGEFAIYKTSPATMSRYEKLNQSPSMSLSKFSFKSASMTHTMSTLKSPSKSPLVPLEDPFKVLPGYPLEIPCFECYPGFHIDCHPEFYPKCHLACHLTKCSML